MLNCTMATNPILFKLLTQNQRKIYNDKKNNEQKISEQLPRNLPHPRQARHDKKDV